MAKPKLCAATLALVLLVPSAALGQAAVDALAQAQSRTLSELVSALPGRPMELDALVSVALERSLSLEASMLARELAEAEVDIEGGIFDPSVQVQSQFVTSRSPLIPAARSVRANISTLMPWGTLFGVGAEGGENLDIFYDPTTAFKTDLSITVSQALLDGLNVIDARYKSADHQRQAGRHRFARAQEQLVAQIMTLYWSLAEAEAVEAVRQRSHELAEGLLLRNEQLLVRDLIAEVDVITARSGVALRRASLINARRRRIDAAEDLVFTAYGASAAQRLASDSLPLKTSTTPRPPPDDMDRASAESDALERRRDVAAAREVLAAATELERRTRSGLRPNVFLDGSWTTSTTPLPLSTELGPLEAPGWKLGLRLSMPVGNRSDRGRAYRATQTVSLGGVGLSIAENAVRQELRSAIRAVRSGLERSAAGDEAAQFAAAQLAAERQRLDLGLGDSFRLLETEENAVQAELESVRSRYDVARATTRLLLARGEIRD